MTRRWMLVGRVSVLLGLLAGALFATGVGSAHTRSRGVSGRFSLLQMAHTSAESGRLPGVNPWDGARRSGVTYVYRGIPCSGMAPLNNLASDLPSYNTRVANSRAPSSLRAHPFQFRLYKVRGKWEMRGSIVFTVCKLAGGPTPANDPVPDAQKPKIHVDFRARFLRVNGETVRYDGRFKLAGGTGRYVGLTGSGSIVGYLFCFAQQGCAKTGGKYTDQQFVMQGTYRDPTPQLATP